DALGGAAAWIIVGAGARNYGDADLFDRIFGEASVFGGRGKVDGNRISKRRNIGHDVVRTARFENGESPSGENVQDAFALLRVRGRKFVVVGLWEMQRDGAGLLKRSRSANGQKIVDFANGLRWSRRSENPTHAPSCDAVGFRQAVDDDGVVAHAIDSGHGDVLGAVVKNVFVNFVGDAVRVPANTEV